MSFATSPVPTYEQVAKMIDHSLLNPTLTASDLELGCKLACDYDVATVCVLPYFLGRAVELLRGTRVLPTTTIGFPHGGHSTSIKVAEAEQALREGAAELDMVANISKTLSGDFGYVRSEISAIAQAAHQAKAKLKVIFENCYLQDQHKIELCRICSEVGADWIKTSTGYGAGGFTFPDIELMLRNVRPGVQVKAAGGVRDLDTLLKLWAMGVTRCGATRTATMLDDYHRRFG